MAKNKQRTKVINDFLSDMTEDLVGEKSKVTDDLQIPDIITFVEHKDWLGLSCGPQPIHLYPAQKIVLKAFYRGSRGNEDLKLTQEEIDWCKDNGLTDSDPEHGRGDILGKISSDGLFRELVLVWGRRSGKDFLVSLIALYEAMRLLEIPGGDPYAYYNLAPGAEISILTIAASKSQASIAFREIREKLRYSKYFSDKYVAEGLQSQCIYLLTKKDKEDNDYFKQRGLPLKNGSVIIEVGHSNPDTLVGKSCFMLVLDEVASYKVGTSGSGSGNKIYALLQPTISTYNRQVPQFDKNGKPIIDKDTGKQKVKTEYEGKIVSISSPRGKEGKLWELWESHSEAKNRLAVRLPTWVVSTKHSKEGLKEEYTSMSNEEFMMEFGAEFSGTAGENMFSPDLIRTTFHEVMELRDIGEPGKTYFVHLDPATNSHNYALVVCHKENYLNKETNKVDFYIVVDHVKVWSPSPGRMIPIDEVDQYVIGLKRRFHLGLVSYDLWNSASSVMKLRKHGIPAKMTSFNSRYKMQIYTELNELMKAERIKIPRFGRNNIENEDITLLYNEMVHLQKRYTAHGFKVYPKKEGDVAKTDDVIDALAGATFLTLSKNVTRLPTGKVIANFHDQSSNNITWRSMQGIPYGTGSGSSVARNMERINSWPSYKR